MEDEPKENQNEHAEDEETMLMNNEDDDVEGEWRRMVSLRSISTSVSSHAMIFQHNVGYVKLLGEYVF
jgi:hypothetical protein